MLIGVPSVLPSKVPERIWTVSLSVRGVTMWKWPGRRRSRSGWISASVKASRGGQPSTTTPTPPPCDSPQVVIRNRCPKVLAIALVWENSGGRSNRVRRWRLKSRGWGDDTINVAEAPTKRAKLQNRARLALRRAFPLPVDDDRRADRIAAAFSAIKGESADRRRPFGNSTTQAKVCPIAAGEDALQQLTFDVSVSKVAVSSLAPSQIA